MTKKQEDEVAEEEDEYQLVIITGIDISVWDLVAFMWKWFLASLIMTFLVGSVGLIIYLLLGLIGIHIR